MDSDCAAGEFCTGCVCAPYCGNGVIDNGEMCETDDHCGPGKSCTIGCECVDSCGNGLLEPGEECEKNSDCNGGSVCSNCACVSSCGNGVIDAGEVCEVDSDCAPGQECLGCQCHDSCGNGVLDAGEACEADSDCATGENCVGCQCQGVPCACGHKIETIEGAGKVTGGGWIYLTKNTYYNPELICHKNDAECQQWANINMNEVLDQQKANYGFNAMWRHGKPYGSTNFDVDGGFFHFHSDTQNTPYIFLEVHDEVHARWFGTGTLATVVAPRRNQWKDGYCFMVAVQDHGEPGKYDTWRIRIWDCTTGMTVDPHDMTLEEFAARGDDEQYLVFDTNYKPGNAVYWDRFPLPNTFQATDPELWRFNGTEVGELLDAGGGGNIQIHLRGKPDAGLDYQLDQGYQCECENAVIEPSDNGFVTGGGWVELDETAYLKDTEPCADPSCEAAVGGIKANFGFNAKFLHGLPDGSTNFDIEGKRFHFHTRTGGGAQYDGLEVVCDSTTYGPQADGVYARWTGVGRVARTESKPTDDSPSWIDGYRFYVAVQDNGEPGFKDMWRIRILDLDGSLLFDADVPANANHQSAIFESDPLLCNPGHPQNPCQASKGWEPDFTGDFLGKELRMGGGNIQVHCKGGPAH